MHKIKLLQSGAWILGVLVGLYAWLDPDRAWYPRPIIGLVAMGVGLLLLFVWALAVGFKREEPRPSFVAHLCAGTPLLAAVAALALAGHGILPFAELPILFIVGVSLAAAQVGKRYQGQPMGRGAEFGVALLGILTLWVIVPALLLATLGEKVWGVVDTDLTRPISRIESTRVLDRYRPTPWTSVTIDDAGMALHSIAMTGGGELGPLLIPAPAASSRPWLADSGPFAHWSADSVLRYAQHGLTDAEKSWLLQAGTHPGRSLIDAVAYAAALDPWAALRLPMSEGVTWPELPLPRVLAIRDAARARLMTAVLPSVTNKHPTADSIFSEVIGYGLRLRDDSDLLLGSIIGANIMREAGLMIAAQWQTEGKTLMADSLSAVLMSGPGRPWGPRDTAATPHNPLTRAAVLAAVRNTTEPRSARFERLGQ
ncbi:MAG TPA: hypothetical protein VL295_08165, partial [Gemmatimonadales bacterium]|nr:hypothetical protein [Gemmatimonadales bacterium]